MTYEKQMLDYFGTNEDILDIQCRPALPGDFTQIAYLTGGMLDSTFGETFGPGGKQAVDILLKSLKTRLRNDCTWVLTEGETIIGVIDLETLETRRLNGQSMIRFLISDLELTDKVEQAGLLPVVLHEPAPDESHQSIVAILQGSRGEGRGTLLLMHGAFWSRAQGKSWMTTWLPENDAFRPVYERRGYYVDRSMDIQSRTGKEAWVLLRRPISSAAYKIIREREKKKK